jgi:outer membrane biosynthesis protein TonB
MTPSSPVFRVALTSASAVVLAITLGLVPGGPAAADSTQPIPASTTAPEQCVLLFCGPAPADDPKPAEPTRTQKPTEPQSPPAAPADPVPAPPEQPAPSVAPPAETAPSPAAQSAGPEESPSPSRAAATGAAASPPPTGASSGQDWNTPVTRSAKPTPVAAVTTPGDPGPDGPALLPVIAGVLLLGTACASFVWWGRNRYRVGAH